MQTIIDNNAPVNLRVDEEALTTSVLAGVERDQHYAVVVETIHYLPGPRTITLIGPLLKSCYNTIMQNTAREQAHEKAHVLNNISVGCQYPGCRDKNHVLANLKCPIKAEDLHLHREEQKLKAGSKGKKGFANKSCKEGKKQ
eukprot:768186-Rhodomonas_salina.1